eukprot:503285_1
MGYIEPNKYVIKIHINAIYVNILFRRKIIFYYNNIVYCRQLSSLFAYTDDTMKYQIGMDMLRDTSNLKKSRMHAINLNSILLYVHVHCLVYHLQASLSKFTSILNFVY